MSGGDNSNFAADKRTLSQGGAQPPQQNLTDKGKGEHTRARQLADFIPQNAVIHTAVLTRAGAAAGFMPCLARPLALVMGTSLAGSKPSLLPARTRTLHARGRVVTAHAPVVNPPDSHHSHAGRGAWGSTAGSRGQTIQKQEHHRASQARQPRKEMRGALPQPTTPPRRNLGCGCQGSAP